MLTQIVHFVDFKRIILLIRHLRKIRLSTLVSLIRYSFRMFDYHFYLENSSSKRNMITGYVYLVTKGLWSGNKVNKYFDPQVYLNSFPQSDLKTNFPLLHYLLKSSGDNPVTSFDRRYLTLNPDLKKYKAPLLYHYMKFKSSECRQLAPEIETLNSRYAIKVKLPEGNSEYNLPYTNIDIRILCGLKPSISDTDSFERKNRIQVFTSLNFAELAESKDSFLEVNSQANSNIIEIEIQTDRHLIFDVKWIRDLLMNYSSEKEYSDTEFTAALQFLFMSVVNRVSGTAELLGDNFPFSASISQAEDRIREITITDYKFDIDENRTTIRNRFLLVSHEDSYTGAPLYLLQVAKCLRTQGIEVLVLCIRAKFKSGVFSSENFNTVYVEDFSSQELLTGDWLLTKLGKELLTNWLQEIAPAQIWVNSINASCFIELATRLSITSCLFVHESFGFKSIDYLANDYESMFHSALEHSSLVVFGSEYSRRSFQHREIRTNGIVQNSLKMNDSKAEKWTLEMRNARRKELGIDPESVVFLSMATFEPRKRINDILKAFTNTTPRNSNLILVGHIEGDRYSERIKMRAKQMKHVHVYPVTKDPSYFYSIADVLIMASEAETYPLVLQEAIHWNLLRIVSRFPGYSASCDEQSALMFDVGNIHDLESLIMGSSTNLQSMQDLRIVAKLDFTDKVRAYHQNLISTLKVLSLINVSIEDFK